MLQKMPFQEAMEQREQAQKVALEALRNASATENVFRIYKYVHGAPCSSIHMAFCHCHSGCELTKVSFVVHFSGCSLM
jgi:hypothetical protein